MTYTSLALLFIALSLLWSSCYHTALYLLSRSGKRQCISMNMMNMTSIAERISIIIPAKNEPIDVLLRSIRSIAEYAKNLRSDVEVIAVLDDPIDRVRGIVKVVNFETRNHNIVIVARSFGAHGRNGAIVDGMKMARGDRLLVLDADCIVDSKVLSDVSACNAICVSPWRSYTVYSTFVEEAMAFLTNYGSWLLYEKRYSANLFLYPLGAGTVISRDLAKQIGYWPRDAIQDDLRLGTILAKLGIEPLLLCSKTRVSVPPTLSAVRIQQSRWAFGSADILRRFGTLILKSRISALKRVEAFIYITQPLMSIPSTIGFILGIVAALTESNVALFGDPYTQLSIYLITFSMVLEGLIIMRYAAYERLDKRKAVFLMGRISAITTIMTPIVALYTILGLVGFKIPYRITPKSLEKRFIDISIPIFFIIALLTLVPSIIGENLSMVFLGLTELTIAIYALKRLT